MILKKMYNENPHHNTILEIVLCLKNGGVIIFPTDTVYALGCDVYNKKSLERIASIKGIKLKDANFSFICHNLSHLSTFAKQISTPTFKLLKRTLPGPFTFILNATNKIPRIFSNKKKTIGIRVPDNNIIRAIVKELGRPIASTSIYDEDDIIEYTTDPELIFEKYKPYVDMVIHGGQGDNKASTVVDCSIDNKFDIIRVGKGDLTLIY